MLDMLGGETMANSFKVLKKGGTLVSIKGEDTEGLAAKYGVRFEWFFMSPDGEMLTKLGALISDGIVKPVIDSVFPMDQAAVAYDQLATRRTVGKIVIAVK
ncbi:zinc-binding dehydrogenase [Pararhizobium sp. IMCC21322]|uniref:zinc-binding dehydrogenase n=1 Tax=Pararhizobium sp. IMCC21322 TaxID=3067903 RepID=UPI003531D4A3